MGLEATVICVDSSEWIRNGDYTPTRLTAQLDAANMISSRKLNPPSHPESSVGVLAMGGKSVRVLSSFTRDIGKLVAAMHMVQPGGKCDLVSGLKIAQASYAILAFKHRLNKAGSQRIIAFVCSPVEEDERKLQRLGKELKKNSIALDIVSMGELEENAPKLRALIDAVNKEGNSHMVEVPPGTLPSDVLARSPIVVEGAEEGGAAPGQAGGGFDEYGGIDPAMDPEMAMAMRMSLMEERERHVQPDDRVRAESAAEATASAHVTAGSGDAPMDEDALLQQALEMSLMEGAADAADQPATSAAAAPATTEAAAPSSAPPAATSDTAASTAAATPAAAPATATSAAPPSGAFSDPDFVSRLLSGLPGVDTSDPRIQAALREAEEQRKKRSEDEGKDASK